MATGTIPNIGFESGNDGNGNYYFKSPDGTLICWGIFNIAQATWATPSTLGSVYGTSCDPNVTFAHAFYSTPSVSATSVDNAVPTARIAPTTTKINLIWIWRHVNSKPPAGDWQYIAVGRWKA